VYFTEKKNETVKVRTDFIVPFPHCWKAIFDVSFKAATFFSYSPVIFLNTESWYQCLKLWSTAAFQLLEVG